MKDKRRLADIILVVVLVISLSTNFYYLNEANKAATIQEPMAAGAILSNQPNARAQSDTVELAKLQKAINEQRRPQVENKKKFLTDISEQLPAVTENDINNSTLGEALNVVKAARQKQYAVIKKVIAGANRYHLTGTAPKDDVLACVSEDVRKGIFEGYREDDYSFYFRVEPARPEETALAGEKGYLYFVYLFEDSYEVKAGDPYGEIQRYLILVVKDGNGWKIDRLMGNT